MLKFEFLIVRGRSWQMSICAFHLNPGDYGLFLFFIIYTTAAINVIAIT